MCYNDFACVMVAFCVMCEVSQCFGDYFCIMLGFYVLWCVPVHCGDCVVLWECFCVVVTVSVFYEHRVCCCDFQSSDCYLCVVGTACVL